MTNIMAIIDFKQMQETAIAPGLRKEFLVYRSTTIDEFDTFLIQEHSSSESALARYVRDVYTFGGEILMLSAWNINTLFEQWPEYRPKLGVYSILSDKYHGDIGIIKHYWQ